MKTTAMRAKIPITYKVHEQNLTTILKAEKRSRVIEELRHTIPGVSNGLQAGSSCCVNLESEKLEVYN